MAGFFINMARVAVFIDYQNVYRRARDAFHAGLGQPSSFGQVSPRAIGDEIVARNSGNTLALVRTYRGLPDGGRDPKGYAACSKQLSAWRTQPLVEVCARPLRYPPNYPTEKPTEKGIDVQLAIDFVLLSLQKKFDVGVIFSADTDLRPALEAVMKLGTARVEVAAWQPPQGYGSRLSVPGSKVWCHYLDQTAYARVADPTDYTK